MFRYAAVVRGYPEDRAPELEIAGAYYSSPLCHLVAMEHAPLLLSVPKP